MSAFGRPWPNARQFDKLPLALLSTTVIGLCCALMTQPFGEEPQERGVFKPPTSSALTPLLEMNSTDVGRIKPAGRFGLRF